MLASLGPAADGLMRHLANSSGLLTFPEAHFDMVRTGIAVYGIHPSPELAGLVDLGADRVEPGDEVVLLGSQGAEEITAQ